MPIRGCSLTLGIEHSQPSRNGLMTDRDPSPKISGPPRRTLCNERFRVIIPNLLCSRGAAFQAAGSQSPRSFTIGKEQIICG